MSDWIKFFIYYAKRAYHWRPAKKKSHRPEAREGDKKGWSSVSTSPIGQSGPMSLLQIEAISASAIATAAQRRRAAEHHREAAEAGRNYWRYPLNKDSEYLRSSLCLKADIAMAEEEAKSREEKKRDWREEV